MGQLRLRTVDDTAGASVATVNNGTIAIVEQSAGVNATMSFSFSATHVVQNAGTSRVRAQARYLDTTGGAGTATLVFLFDARLDVLHMRRS